METYKIYATTDGKFIGMNFTVNEVNKTIDIFGIDADDKIINYEFIHKTLNRIRINNVNYTFKGIKL